MAKKTWSETSSAWHAGVQARGRAILRKRREKQLAALSSARIAELRAERAKLLGLLGAVDSLLAAAEAILEKERKETGAT